MKEFILSVGSYILGGIIILTLCIKLFTKNPPSVMLVSVLLVFSFVLVALPFATSISIEIKDIKVKLETAANQVSELQKQIQDLKAENAELSNQITQLNNQIAILNNPNSTQIQKLEAKAYITAAINGLNTRLIRIQSKIDTAEIKSAKVMDNLNKIRSKRLIFRKH